MKKQAFTTLAMVILFLMLAGALARAQTDPAARARGAEVVASPTSASPIPSRVNIQRRSKRSSRPSD